MKVKKAIFVKSAVDSSGYPVDDLPEIAFAGRSNVGKSSLINTLLGMRLAVVSKSPGRTRTINFFKVDDAFYVVDLPGYGYAKVSRQVVGSWGEMIEGYIEGSLNLRGLVHIIDSRHEPSEGDKLMQDYLRHHGVPTVVVATKIDKLPRSKVRENVERITQALGLQESAEVIPFSALTRDGKRELGGAIASFLDSEDEQQNGAEFSR